MPETIYKELHDDAARPAGAFELIRGLDKNVRDISGELYIFRRATEYRIASMTEDISELKNDISELKRDSANLKDDVSELKAEVKELRRDISDIKGDIKALSAGFNSAQNRFNWGLIVLGLFVALIQLLK